MDRLALILFTLITLMPLGARNSLEPALEWRFHLRACSVCIDQQMNLMADFLRPQDTIIVYAHTESEKLTTFQHRLLTRFTNVQIKVESESTKPGVGWFVYDRDTGETILYHSDLGAYNSMRSRYLLSALR